MRPAIFPSTATNITACPSRRSCSARSNRSCATNPQFFAQLPIAEDDAAAINRAKHAAAGSRLKSGNGRNLQPPLFRRTHDRRGKGMFTSTFHARAQAQDLRLPEYRKASRLDANAGLPSVSVPVLSTTSVSTFSRISSASAFRTSTPDVAPRPMPTMMDIGVARPSAQGHAIIKTATAFRRPVSIRGSGPMSSPHDECDGRHSNHGWNKPCRHDIRQPLDWSAAALRLSDHLNNLRQYRVAPHAFGAHDERSGSVDRSADNGGSRRFLHGNRAHRKSSTRRRRSIRS